MAVGVLTAAPEATKEIYDAVTEKMFGHAAPMREDEAPEGLIAHSAGQGVQGYYVYDIWESREAFERFAKVRGLKRLMTPIVQRTMDAEVSHLEQLKQVLERCRVSPPPIACRTRAGGISCSSPASRVLRSDE